jgi:hypothetical protein
MRIIAQPIYGGAYRRLWCDKLGKPNQLWKWNTWKWGGIQVTNSKEKKKACYGQGYMLGIGSKSLVNGGSWITLQCRRKY